MKQLLAIFFIGIFALSQYAKQLSYLECKLANSLKTSEQHCDCEKQTPVDTFAGKEFPSSKNHAHFSIDEFYSHLKETGSKISFIARPAKISLYTVADECKGNCNRLYRPPRV